MNKDVDEDYFWEMFLHEHLHILQYKIGYKDLKSATNPKLALFVNNVIMDIDVIERLKHDYNFERTSEYGREICSKACINEIGKFLIFGASEEDAKFMAILIAFIYFCFNRDEANRFAEPMNGLNTKFEYYYNGFIELVRNDHCIRSKPVNDLLCQAATLFGIKSYRLT